jgi:hypothetical protein
LCQAKENHFAYGAPFLKQRLRLPHTLYFQRALETVAESRKPVKEEGTVIS